MRLKKAKLPARRERRYSDDTSAAPAAFSYYARRAEHATNTGRTPDRPSNAVLARANQNRRRHQLVFLSAVVLIIVLLGLSFLSSDAKVEIISTAQSSQLLKPKTEYQAAADEAVKGSILNRSKLVFNDTAVEQKLAKQYPELGAVNVHMPLLGNKPVVTLEAAEPALQLMTGNGTYVIDTSGKAVVLVSNLKNPSALHLPLVVDQNNLPAALNNVVLPSNTVAFIEEIAGQLAAKKIVVTKLTLPRAANEVDATLQGRPYTVKFNTQTSSARQQAGTFLATINQLQNQHIQPSQYVDVRVEGRAYYK